MNPDDPGRCKILYHLTFTNFLLLTIISFTCITFDYAFTFSFTIYTGDFRALRVAICNHKRIGAYTQVNINCVYPMICNIHYFATFLIFEINGVCTVPN